MGLYGRMDRVTRIVIIGGGPGGYEAALVAAQLGGEVTVIESDGLGGSTVLTDCVPSKTLIATAEVMTEVAGASELGVRFADPSGDDGEVTTDLGVVNARVKALALAQSEDIAARLAREGIEVVRGRGRLDGPQRVVATAAEGGEQAYDADAVLIATGASPRLLPDAMPDGERILTWTQLYDLAELPEHLVVVGSGVTGAEFASAYRALGAEVTLVSSRDRVLPHEDEDAALVLGDVFKARGMNVLSRSRAVGVSRTGDGVEVTLTDGRTVSGSHCLMAVGSIPNTADMGLEEAGVALGQGGECHRRPGVADVGAKCLRRGRLHWRAVAGQRCRDARAHRDVARARRRGDAARLAQCVRQRVYGARDRQRGVESGVYRCGGDPGADGQAAAGDQCARQDAGHP